MLAGNISVPAPCRMSEMSPRIATKIKAQSLIVVIKIAELGPMDLEIRLRVETRRMAHIAVILFLHQLRQKFYRTHLEGPFRDNRFYIGSEGMISHPVDVFAVGISIWTLAEKVFVTNPNIRAMMAAPPGLRADTAVQVNRYESSGPN